MFVIVAFCYTLHTENGTKIFSTFYSLWSITYVGFETLNGEIIRGILIF